jgi:imidazole glycerol phosphate synthase glutamine amidotransferase subunit
MIGVIDYGAGNLQSVINALNHLGLPTRRCVTPDDLRGLDRLLLPGVGQFGAAVRRLADRGLDGAVLDRVDAGVPLLGICLGLQLLLQNSDEAVGVTGLGLLPGRTERLEASIVPHMGWNRVVADGPCPLIDGDDAPYFYFAHSYVARLDSPTMLAGYAELDGRQVPAIVGRDRIWGVQFHPEKSGRAGLDLLRKFAAC